MSSLTRIGLIYIVALAASACGFDHGAINELPDGPAPTITVTFDEPATDADEAFGTVSLAVSLSELPTSTVTVDYSVTGGTASRPADFTLTDGTLTFAAGQRTRTIDVAIVADTAEEQNETIIVGLAGPTGATLGATTSHTITISSDVLPRVSFTDVTPSSANEATNTQVEVTLSIAPKTQVSVQLGVAGTASPAGVDHAATDGQLITFAIGVTTQMVSLGIVQDALDENDETVDLGFKNPSTGLLIATTNTSRMHTITDDDPLPTVFFAAATSTTPESQSTDLTVNLSPVSGRMVTVAYAVSGGTATSADATVVDAPGTLTFLPGQTSKTISVTVANDMVDEPSETLAVTLLSPANATLGAPSTHTLTITDDDNPPTVAFAAATSSVNEMVVAVNLTVSLSEVSGFDVIVPFSVSNTSTANNPDDYTITASPITIPAGMPSANIVVSVKADPFDEDNETVIVTLGTPTNATPGIILTHTLTINDDDLPPTVAFTQTGSSPNEGNTTITLTVQLSEISGRDVVVPYTIGAASTAVNPADYTISPASPITIPAGQTSTTIVITIFEENLYETDETVIVTLDLPTFATLGTPSTYTLTIRNDDSIPDVTWGGANGSATEGTHPPGSPTTQVTYTLVLSSPTSFTVSVPILYTGTAGSADYSGPSSVSFPPGTLSVDVVLTIARDAVFEPGLNETIIMTIDAAGVMNAGTTNQLIRTHSIVDDD